MNGWRALGLVSVVALVGLVGCGASESSTKSPADAYGGYGASASAAPQPAAPPRGGWFDAPAAGAEAAPSARQEWSGDSAHARADGAARPRHRVGRDALLAHHHRALRARRRDEPVRDGEPLLQRRGGRARDGQPRPASAAPRAARSPRRERRASRSACATRAAASSAASSPAARTTSSARPGAATRSSSATDTDSRLEVRRLRRRARRARRQGREPSAKRGYLVDPHGELEIDGFRQSMETVAAFRFGSVRGSYADQKHGDTRNVGVIGVALFNERGTNPFPWTQRRGRSAATTRTRSRASSRRLPEYPPTMSCTWFNLRASRLDVRIAGARCLLPGPRLRAAHGSQAGSAVRPRARSGRLLPRVDAARGEAPRASPAG